MFRSQIYKKDVAYHRDKAKDNSEDDVNDNTMDKGVDDGYR